MKLIDMKLSKKESKDSIPTCSSSEDGPRYPYGLSLRLEEDSLKKLGIKSLPKVGETLKISALGTVKSVSAHENQESEQRSVEIQIEQLGVGEDGPKMEETLRSRYRLIKAKEA